MVSICNKFFLGALLSCVLTGCGLNTPVLQRGGNGRMGVLLNYSCGAHWCDPIDPNKPTIVFTHGWNPLPKRIHVTFGQAASQSLRCRYGDACNLLSWDWSAVRVSPFRGQPVRIGRCQGRKMAIALRVRGVDPVHTQLIAHSLGTVVAAQAACCLSDLGPFAQLTLLDPPENMHDEIFRHLAAPSHARVVENYWAPGISGFGAQVNQAGVRNYIVRGTTPWRGMVDLSISNHMYVMRWYYQTIGCPKMPYGFQQSVLMNPDPES